MPEHTGKYVVIACRNCGAQHTMESWLRQRNPRWWLFDEFGILYETRECRCTSTLTLTHMAGEPDFSESKE